jgi:hypothetical protein
MVDKLHKGVVITCIGATLYGCALLGFKFYRYFTVTRPQRKLKEIDENKHLLLEGIDTSEKAFQDSAPELKL